MSLQSTMMYNEPWSYKFNNGKWYTGMNNKKSLQVEPHLIVTIQAYQFDVFRGKVFALNDPDIMSIEDLLYAQKIQMELFDNPDKAWQKIAKELPDELRMELCNTLLGDQVKYDGFRELII